MEIQACPACASLDLHVPGVRDGALLGYATVTAVCGSCGFQGAPLLFDDPADHQAFRETVGVPGSDTPEGEEGTAEEARSLEPPGGPVVVRSPATAVFIGGLGAVGLVVSLPLLVLRLLAMPAAVAAWDPWGAVMELLGLLLLAVGVLVSWAVLRIARRLWRGTADPAGGA